MTRALVIANFVQACCWWVERAPEAGETRSAQHFLSEPGGKGLNVAVALQRLSLPTIPVLAHGNDAAAGSLRQLLQQEGLSLQHVHALDMPSGWGAGFVEPNGQNRIAVFAGANAHLSRTHIQQAQPLMAHSHFVYAQFEVAFAAAEEAMRLGHAANCPTVLNPSPWQALSADLRASVACYIVNHSEAAHLLNIPFQEPAAGHAIAPLLQTLAPAVAQFWPQHPAAQELIVTLGAWGCVGWQRPTPAQTHPHPIAKSAAKVTVKDTVGCGDAFSAAYCWARFGCDQAMTHALEVGNACGAHVASCTGVLHALPTAAQVRAWGLR